MADFLLSKYQLWAEATQRELQKNQKAIEVKGKSQQNFHFFSFDGSPIWNEEVSLQLKL